MSTRNLFPVGLLNDSIRAGSFYKLFEVQQEIHKLRTAVHMTIWVYLLNPDPATELEFWHCSMLQYNEVHMHHQDQASFRPATFAPVQCHPGQEPCTKPKPI